MLSIAFFYCLNPKVDEHRISLNGIDAWFKFGMDDNFFNAFTIFLLIFVNYVFNE